MTVALGARRRARATHLAPVLISIASVVVLIGVWYAATDGLALVDPLSLPSPGAVLGRLVDLAHEPYLGHTIWGHSLASVKVMLLGWVVAGLVGIPLGVSMSWLPWARRLLLPIFSVLRSISPVAWIPLAIIWLGIDTEARAFIVFISAVVPWTVSAREAVDSVDPLLVRAAQTLGAGRQTLVRVVLPAGLPTLLAGARIALGNAWTALIAAELLAATAGLGFLSLNSSRVLDTPTVLASMAVIGLLGMLFSIALVRVAALLAPWQKGR